MSPSNVLSTCIPVDTSHNLIRNNPPPLASSFPSGLKAIHFTSDWWELVSSRPFNVLPLNLFRCTPVTASQSSIKFPRVLAINRPSGLIATFAISALLMVRVGRQSLAGSVLVGSVGLSHGTVGSFLVGSVGLSQWYSWIVLWGLAT